MEGQSIFFEIIEKYDIFEKLLKNEVTIYGSFVRRVLIEKQSIKELANSKYPSIHCYAKAGFKDIIERDLYDYIIDKVVYNHRLSSGNTVIAYFIKFENFTFTLEILYIRSLMEFKPIYFENDLQCIINIDALSITRLGISALDIFKNSPFLFKEIIRDIRNKQFFFKSSIARLSDLDKHYITYLLSSGYKNLQCKIKDYTNISNNICSICYENDNEPHIQLSCGHIYHKCCIRESINIVFNDKDKAFYLCPYCSHQYTESELL